MAEKIRLTYLIDALGSGGAQTHVLNVLKNIDHDRFQVSLICVRGKGIRFSQIENYPVECLVLDMENLMRPMETIRGLSRIRRFLRKNHTGILHAYMFNPTILAGIAKILHGRNTLLITSRRDVGYWHQRHHWWAYRALNRITDKVVAVTNDVRNISIDKEHLDPEKIITIYNGIDTDFYAPQKTLREEVRAELGIGNNEIVIGMLAVLRPEKRHDLFVKAAEKISRENPDTRFLVVGGGYQSVIDQVHSMLDEMNLTDRFIFTGKVTNSRRWLSAFDISVLCSDTEGMSNTLLESLAMGLPVVATRTGGNPEVIEDTVTGLLVPCNDHEALADAVLSVSSDSSLRQKFAENSRLSATERFSIDGMTKRMEKLYEELLARKSPK